jgi:hypothetical protein
MTKQEKLAVKNSLMTIKDSLFSDAWDEIVSDHPYVLQDDEDIEDDFVVQDKPIEINPVSIGMMKIQQRRDSIRGSTYIEMENRVLSIASTLGVTLQLIEGVAQGNEEGLGFYMQNSEVFVRQHSSADMALVLTRVEDEKEYLESLGYTNISELFDNQSNTNN